MARRADDLRSRLVVVNPDEDCSPAAFHALIDELGPVLLVAPESDIESLDAASVLEALRLLLADDMVWWMADALPWGAWHAGRVSDARRLQLWADGLAEARAEKRGPFYGRMREALMAHTGQTDRDEVLPVGHSALNQAQAIDLALGPGTAAPVMARVAKPN